MSRLTKNIIYNIIGQSILLILNFVAVRLVFKKLGGDVLGVIYFTMLINSIFRSVLEQGVCKTVVREIASFFKTEPEYISKLIQTGSFFFWAVYVFVVGMIFLAAPFIAERWLKLDTLNTHTAVSAIRILGIFAFLEFPVAFYASLLRGLQRMEYNNIIEVSTMLLMQVGTIVVITARGGFLTLTIWMAFCYFLRLCIYLAISSRFFKLPSFIPAYNPAVIARNFAFTSRLVVVTVLSMVHSQIDKIIISKLMPVSVLGCYGVLYGSVSKVQMITAAVAEAAFPSLTENINRNEKAEALAKYRKLQDLVCFLVAVILAAVPFAAIPLFSYLFNPETAQKLFIPAILLSVGFFLNSAMNVPYIFSLSAGQPGIAAKLNLYALFVVLPLAVPLVYYLGLAGAGLSWVIYNIFGCVYAMPKICRRCIGISPASWYIDFLKIASLLFLTYGVALAIILLFFEKNIFTYAAGYLLATAVFAVGEWFIISAEMKEVLYKYLRFS